MKVNAFVLEGSHPVRGWESRRKVSGVLSGVRFYKKGRTFVALDLSPDEVERAQNNRFVRLEIVTAPRPLPIPKPSTPEPVSSEPVNPPEVSVPVSAPKKIDPLMQGYGAPVKRRGRKPKSLS